jgi:hypothetical protein
MRRLPTNPFSHSADTASSLRTYATICAGQIAALYATKMPRNCSIVKGVLTASCFLLENPLWR